jgi:hypothetical protein
MSAMREVDSLKISQLDHLVAEAEGIWYVRTLDDFIIRVTGNNQLFYTTQSGRSFPFSPCIDWRQGGAIIEKNNISVTRVADGWEANCDGAAVARGNTPLLAAMRTRVKMKYGDQVKLDD